MKDDAMVKKSKSKAKKKKGAPTSKQKETRDIGEMLDTIRLDWKDLSKTRRHPTHQGLQEATTLV